MSDDFDDEDGPSLGMEPVRDPWLHFTITSEGLADDDEPQDVRPESYAAGGIQETEARRSQTGSGSWASDSEGNPDAASLLAEDLFRRRRRGDTDSFSGGLGPVRPAGDSMGTQFSCKLFPGSLGGTSSRQRLRSAVSMVLHDSATRFLLERCPLKTPPIAATSVSSRILRNQLQRSPRLSVPVRRKT